MINMNWPSSSEEHRFIRGFEGIVVALAGVGLTAVAREHAIQIAADGADQFWIRIWLSLDTGVVAHRVYRESTGESKEKKKRNNLM